MKVYGRHYRSIWRNADGVSVDVIDQTRLPHEFEILNLANLDDACRAIRDMVVRGAPLIGATAAYGLALALQDDASDKALTSACDKLFETRPTAVNLRWALDRVSAVCSSKKPSERAQAAMREADAIAEEDVAINRSIGERGAAIIAEIARKKSNREAVNILTHCNAGWLATVDWGTATAPIYLAQEAGIELHVWVDETRPRNQGTLTAWELAHQNVPHTYIVDNAGGHLMQHGRVDLCLVGSDRTLRSGEVCNKIGTYLKALAARDNGIPFYVCLPSSTIDWNPDLDGVPIEQRGAWEVERIAGLTRDNQLTDIGVVPSGTPVANPAFDVTPAHLVTALITERAVVEANEASLSEAFPDLSGGAGSG